MSKWADDITEKNSTYINLAIDYKYFFWANIQISGIWLAQSYLIKHQIRPNRLVMSYFII